jgi:hypothetical protein
MIVLKKDFVHEDTESFCAKGKKLSSGKAFYLKDINGNIHYGGKQCAEKHATNDLSQIPDLTKSLIARHDGHSTEGGSGRTDGEQNNTEKSKAITYILLREEILSHYTLSGKGISYSILEGYYKIYQKDNDLPKNTVNHILNIEKKSTKRLSLKNLLNCHAHQYILERTLDHLTQKGNVKGIKFINDLLDGLTQYCSLTDKQIDGLSKWLQYLPKDLSEAKLKKFDV